MSILKAENIGQSAGPHIILKNVNVDIEKGEVFVIIGPTGAGKTTLLRILNLLDKPTAGSIYFDGIKVWENPGSMLQMQRRMCMVFQKPVVFNSSVYDNVAYPLKVRGLSRRKIGPLVERMLDITGLTGYSARKARTLSGGEAQRVALARAMIASPEVLFLDEPTANLDPASVKLIEDLVVRFNKESGVTIVMATHDMRQGQRLAHRVGVLMQSELVQVGRPSEIFELPENIRIADFVGIKNIMPGVITENTAGVAIIDVKGWLVTGISELPVHSKVNIYISPDDIILSKNEITSSARNSIKGVITFLTFSGSRCQVQLGGSVTLEVLITRKSAEDLDFKVGDEICASFKASAVRVLLAVNS
jgi:tungstate transport system ATP-binding protein